MSYLTPITDRDAADIAAENSKAFFNVADWARVYGNSQETNTNLNTALGLSISFDTITAVVTKDIPTVSEINAMLANIERMRLWSSRYLYKYITDSAFVEIKDNWSAGQSEDAPNYTHVNSWEKVIDLLHNYLNPFVPPAISGNLTLKSGTDLELIAGGNLELTG